LTTINEGVFKLTTIETAEIPQGVTSIGGLAFAYCESLTTVSIPESVTHIGFNAFLDCHSIEYEIHNDNIKYLGNWVMGTTSKDITSADLKSNTVGIYQEAFKDCQDLSAITLNDGLKIIGNKAFYSSGITQVEIPDSVMHIEKDAFNLCGNLTDITIGSGIEEIEDYAFHHCGHSVSDADVCVYISAEFPPKIGENTFKRSNKKLKIYVYYSIYSYKSAQYWSFLADNIYEVPL